GWRHPNHGVFSFHTTKQRDFARDLDAGRHFQHSTSLKGLPLTSRRWPPNRDAGFEHRRTYFLWVNTCAIGAGRQRREDAAIFCDVDQLSVTHENTIGDVNECARRELDLTTHGLVGVALLPN